MTRCLRTACFGLALLVYLAAANSASRLIAEEITSSTIEEILEPIRKDNDVPALAAAVVRLDQPTVVGAVGVRKQGDDTKVEASDKFHLGSCTKAMTASLIAHLVEEGKLKWDDPLDRLFPKLKDKISPELRGVTLAHLLAHQSALVDLELSEFWKLSSSGKPAKQRMGVVEQAVAQKPTEKPGEHFHYANINYIVAAAAAEQVAGKSWEELIEAEVFKPLKMKSAGFGTMATAGKVDQPWSHEADRSPVKPGLHGDNAPVLGPAGRVHCSLADWAEFASDHLRGGQGKQALLQPDSYKLLHTPEFKGSNYTRGGWGSVKTPSGVALAHDGSNTLNYSSALLLPEKGIAILVAANQGAPNQEKGGGTACQQAREALLKLVLKAKK